MKDPLPPLHVAIASSIAMALGVHSVLGFIARPLSGLPVNILDVWFIIGLMGWVVLSGKRSLRLKMMVMGALIFLANGVTAAVMTAFQIFGKSPWIPLDTPRDLTSAVLISASALYIFLVFRSPLHRPWFDEKDITDEQRLVERDAGKRMAIPVLVASLILGALAHVQEWWSNESVRAAYPIHVRLIPHDAETGRGIAANFLPDFSSDSSRDWVRFPRYQSSLLAVPVGDDVSNMITVDGVGSHPFKYTITSEGYQPAKVTISRDSPNEIRVPMKRVK